VKTVSLNSTEADSMVSENLSNLKKYKMVKVMHEFVIIIIQLKKSK